MLRLAGVGVAVADATGSCRAAADRQTRASYEDGVAWACLLYTSPRPF